MRVEQVLKGLLGSCPGLLVDGVNTENAVGSFRRSGGGIQRAPGQAGDRCVFFVSDYEWHSNSAPAGITTKLALDVLIFSKAELLKAIRSGASAFHLTGTRLWDCGIWEDACHDFETDGLSNAEIVFHVDLFAGTLALDFDRTQGPKHWTEDHLRSL